jgi:hypothetical protein
MLKSSTLIALLISASSLNVILPLSPASAQLFPGQTPTISNSPVIPEGTKLPVEYKEAEKILVTREETMDVTLTVAANVRDRSGQILIPYGSQIIGQIQPANQKDGSRFVANTIVINGRNYPLRANSKVINTTETVHQGASAGEILGGAAAGAAAASVIAAVTGNHSVSAPEVLGGAGLGALAGWIIGSGSAELIVIYPNKDLEITLRKDLVLS